MQYKIVSSVLAQPIERIRGGDIVVALTTTFSTEDGENVFSGFAVVKDESKISEGFSLALKNSIDNFQQHTKTITDKNFVNTVKTVSAHKKESIATALKATNKDAETLLQAPANKAKQMQLDQLCQTLGLNKIDVLNGEWTLLEVQALIVCLEDFSKPLEVK